MRRLRAFPVVVLALCGTASAATLPLVITQVDNGGSFVVKRGTTPRLRLSGHWTWTTPRVSGRSIRLAPISYRADRAYREWEIRTISRGKATINSSSTPNCRGCTGLRRFHVVIVVS